MPYDDSVLVGDLLHAFLCQSPHLLHLKAEGVNIQLNLLSQFTPSSVNADRVNADPLRCDGVITSEKCTLWACRNLKTLHLQFDCRMRDDRKSDNNSRKLFGYISRVCPKLEDLSICRKDLTLGVRSGFCLLSNLSRLRQLRISVLDEQELGDGDLDWIKREYHYSSQQDNCSVSELRLMEMISKEEWAIAEEERQFRELEKLHQKYNIPINQGDIPLSLRDAQLNKPGGNAITKKQTSTSLLSKIRSKMFKDSASASIEPDVIETSTSRRPNIVDGIDMQNWGEDSDLLEYFKKRKAQRDVSLWPVMEFLEIRMGASAAYQPPIPTSISLSIKKYRPDIEVISPPNTYIPHIYIRRVDL
ncbi:hypothetical protein BGZ49_001319 [Haplosporangium sp. Z 27]|nr:hypothetical protein BGZ49_001319 [Haplosporangium sp. Z 27]